MHFLTKFQPDPSFSIRVRANYVNMCCVCMYMALLPQYFEQVSVEFFPEIMKHTHSLAGDIWQ